MGLAEAASLRWAGAVRCTPLPDVRVSTASLVLIGDGSTRPLGMSGRSFIHCVGASGAVAGLPVSGEVWETVSLVLIWGRSIRPLGLVEAASLCWGKAVRCTPLPDAGTSTVSLVLILGRSVSLEAGGAAFTSPQGAGVSASSPGPDAGVSAPGPAVGASGSGVSSEGVWSLVSLFRLAFFFFRRYSIPRAAHRAPPAAVSSIRSPPYSSARPPWAASRSWPRKRWAPSSRPRRTSSFGAALTLSFNLPFTVRFSLIFAMIYHLPQRRTGPQSRPCPRYFYEALASSERSDGRVVIKR